MNWLNDKLLDRCVIAVDGKTIRGIANKNHKVYHVVGTFVAENQIALREVCVDEKTNEITDVPELLDLLYTDDTIITTDSMICQKKIAENNADYCIELKENQPNFF